jgi:hypothetical protein
MCMESGWWHGGRSRQRGRCPRRCGPWKHLGPESWFRQLMTMHYYHD